MTRLDTPHGSLAGFDRPDGGTEYRGIRFASAARFADPIDDPGDNGELGCTAWGPLCPQNPGLLETMAGYDPSGADEDCLNLNVFVPPGTAADSRLPVMVWIHGGAYLNGAGSLAWYHGSRLAAGGAIVVTINYRLGVLGYLGRGNHGTLDQISALRWVSRNIASFGGDPGKVTIFGESAGGSAVISLMAAPSARGLFHRVWAMSPSIGQLRDTARADESERDYLTLLGVASSDELRDAPIERLLSAQAEHITSPSKGYDHFSPTAGGTGLDALLLGSAADNPVPLVIGTTRDENKLFSAFDPQSTSKTEQDWVKFSDEVFGNAAPDAREVYRRLRGGEPWELISAVNTDIAFRQHVRRLAEARHHAQNPTWVYWFTWASTAFGGRFGSCHALDIPFAFDNLEAQGVEGLTGNSADRAPLATRFGEELHLLAAHGHVSWAQWDNESRPTLRFDSTVELLNDPEPEVRALFA